MNLRSEFSNALSKIKNKSSEIKARIDAGSKDANDYIDGAYYSGLHNGFNLVWYVLDNHLSAEEFNQLLDDLLKETIN